MSAPNELTRTLTGRGLLGARGCEPARVRYRLLIERRDGGPFVHGTLWGRHDALRPIWLEPDAQLRLAGGHRIDVSLTDLVGDEGEFEGIGPLPPILA